MELTKEEIKLIKNLRKAKVNLKTANILESSVKGRVSRKELGDSFKSLSFKTKHQAKNFQRSVTPNDVSALDLISKSNDLSKKLQVMQEKQEKTERKSEKRKNKKGEEYNKKVRKNTDLSKALSSSRKYNRAIKKGLKKGRKGIGANYVSKVYKQRKKKFKSLNPNDSIAIAIALTPLSVSLRLLTGKRAHKVFGRDPFQCVFRAVDKVIIDAFGLNKKGRNKKGLSKSLNSYLFGGMIQKRKESKAVKKIEKEMRKMRKRDKQIEEVADQIFKTSNLSQDECLGVSKVLMLENQGHTQKEDFNQLGIKKSEIGKLRVLAQYSRNGLEIDGKVSNIGGGTCSRCGRSLNCGFLGIGPVCKNK